MSSISPASSTPTSAALPPESKNESAKPSESYTVNYGDSMASIADKSGHSQSDLIALNPNAGHPDRLTPGDKINLPSSETLIAKNSNQTAKRIFADPRELMPVDTIVLHETTRGFMTRGEPSNIDNLVKKTNVNTDVELKGNSDFVIMQDGHAFQQNRHGNSYSEGSRLNTGIADGHGTLREYKGALIAAGDPRANTRNFAAITQGRALDIEIDYKSGPSTKVGTWPLSFDTKPMNSKQYTSTVETVVDAAMLKRQGMIAASRRDESDKSPVITVATHKDVDAGITGQGKLHQDPSGLNMKGFEASVKAELKSRGLPETLVSFQKPAQWK